MKTTCSPTFAGLTLNGLLKVLAPPDADALTLGDATHEGGDFAIYSDALGHKSFRIDADYSEFYLNEPGKDEEEGSFVNFFAASTMSGFIVANPDALTVLSSYFEPELSYLWITAPDELSMFEVSLLPAAAGRVRIEGVPLEIAAVPDAVALQIGDATHEGGDFAIFRDALNHKQLSVDADALENAVAMTLYGKLQVGETKPVILDGNVGNVKADTISEITLNAGVDVDGVLLKDSEPYCDVIHEKTAGAGVTVDGVLCKDGGLPSVGDVVPASHDAYDWGEATKYWKKGYVKTAYITTLSLTNFVGDWYPFYDNLSNIGKYDKAIKNIMAYNVYANIIKEHTLNTGVTIEDVLLKDGSVEGLFRTTHLLLKEELATMFAVRNVADTAYRNLGVYDLYAHHDLYSYNVLQFLSGDRQVIFDSSDFLTYDTTNDRYLFYIGGSVVGYVDATGFHNGAP